MDQQQCGNWQHTIVVADKKDESKAYNMKIYIHIHVNMDTVHWDGLWGNGP